MNIEIQSNKLIRYWMTSQMIGLLSLWGIMTGFALFVVYVEGMPSWFGIGMAIWVLVAVAIAYAIRSYGREFVGSIEYWLDEDVLYITQKNYQTEKKAIPLDRVTEIRLVQGVIMGWYDVWNIQIQTAGNNEAEATLYAVVNPEKTRDRLLLARKEALNYAQDLGFNRQ